MRRQADGKARRSREEWVQIFDRFRSSRQSGAAFCRKHKLPRSSFEKWRKKVGPRLAVKEGGAEFRGVAPRSGSGAHIGVFGSARFRRIRAIAPRRHRAPMEAVARVVGRYAT
ncbi:MAG: hypothetical protein DRQ56_10400 [Gammaproteobacteria bacterium]|nr:MAG: hypothetical protein DRQ56_10400 [Gammaproteobacteria bacterium]